MNQETITVNTPNLDRLIITNNQQEKWTYQTLYLAPDTHVCHKLSIQNVIVAVNILLRHLVCLFECSFSQGLSTIHGFWLDSEFVWYSSKLDKL